MALKSDFMGSSAPASLASKLGFDPVTAITAAGTTQATATALNCNCANVTTPTVDGGVIITSPIERNFVYNSGPNSLLVYPPVGSTIIGLAVNVAINIASGSSVSIEGNGTNLLANVSI